MRATTRVEARPVSSPAQEALTAGQRQQAAIADAPRRVEASPGTSEARRRPRSRLRAEPGADAEPLEPHSTGPGPGDYAGACRRSCLLHLRGPVRHVELVKAGRTPIEGVTNHSLRRTFCALLYEAGASPAYMMAQMGHTDDGRFGGGASCRRCLWGPTGGR
jgi:integrase